MRFDDIRRPAAAVDEIRRRPGPAVVEIAIAPVRSACPSAIRRYAPGSRRAIRTVCECHIALRIRLLQPYEIAPHRNAQHRVLKKSQFQSKKLEMSCCAVAPHVRSGCSCTAGAE